MHTSDPRRAAESTGVHAFETPTVRGGTLDSWLAFPWHLGAQLDELEDLHLLRVRTINTTYEIAVAGGAPGEILVRGGRYFPEWTRAHLVGSTLGGGFLKRYGIHSGLRMEICWKRRRVITSPVQTIEHVGAHRELAAVS
jgi:hypothetical protein